MDIVILAGSVVVVAAAAAIGLSSACSCGRELARLIGQDDL